MTVFVFHFQRGVWGLRFLSSSIVISASYDKTIRVSTPSSTFEFVDIRTKETFVQRSLIVHSAH